MKSIEHLVRKKIKELNPYNSIRESNLKNIFLDANENSYGSAIDDFEELNLNRFPDPYQNELRVNVGKFYSIDKDSLFLNSDSAEIIELLIKIFCEPNKDEVIFFEPADESFQFASEINNIKVNKLLLNDSMQIDFERLNIAYNQNVKLIFISSPNNVTGNLIDKNNIHFLYKNYNSIIVVDEAYIDFAEENSLIREAASAPNLVILRTFSYAWGLAGLRLAFCIAHKEIIAYLFKVNYSLNINTITVSIVRTLFRHYERRNIFIRKIINERKKIFTALNSFKFIKKIYPSEANFLLFECYDAKTVYNELAEAGIFVKVLSEKPMFKNFLRVTVGTEEENNIFIERLKKIENKR